MRVGKDQYFMNLADVVATRSTCLKANVGAVIVAEDGTVFAVGYNGAPPGMPHCEDEGCAIYAGGCVRCVHAEANALLRAGEVLRGTLYSTRRPCLDCCKLIISCGITRVVHGGGHRPDGLVRALGFESEDNYLRSAGIEVVEWEEAPAWRR